MRSLRFNVGCATRFPYPSPTFYCEIAKFNAPNFCTRNFRFADYSVHTAQPLRVTVECCHLQRLSYALRQRPVWTQEGSPEFLSRFMRIAQKSNLRKKRRFANVRQFSWENAFGANKLILYCSGRATAFAQCTTLHQAFKTSSSSSSSRVFVLFFSVRLWGN